MSYWHDVKERHDQLATCEPLKKWFGWVGETIIGFCIVAKTSGSCSIELKRKFR
jgi:hypothetical protein